MSKEWEVEADFKLLMEKGTECKGSSSGQFVLKPAQCLMAAALYHKPVKFIYF
jgi:hypothetical protein